MLALGCLYSLGLEEKFEGFFYKDWYRVYRVSIGYYGEVGIRLCSKEDCMVEADDGEGGRNW